MEEVNPLIILKARIALLSTAIGGPDYTSDAYVPSYRLGDEALPCLKDLKRWFKLVDDQQNRLDVAMASAEYRILIDDLIPILIEWENKSAMASKKNNGTFFINKPYYDKIALQSLQLMVLMTWPLILTDQSTVSQVNNYTELKKYQLAYKKAILSTQNGKVLKAIVRIVTDIMRINRIDRSPRDNMVLKLALNFFRNVVAIEPGELTITTKKKIPKGINSVDTLPPGISYDDISLNSVVSSFQKNKVFKLLLTLCSTINQEFDQDFVNVPLLEIMVYLTKDINQEHLFSDRKSNKDSTNDKLKSVYLSKPNLELSDLLNKETQMKKNLIKNTSSRHSRFGAMLSIQTPNGGRLTVSGGQNLLNDTSALDKIDARKKWNKRQTQRRNDPLEEGLPDSLFNSQITTFPLLESTSKLFVNFLNNFLDSGFNILLHSITNYFTTEQDRLVTIEQIEFLLFISWFIKYQVRRCQDDKNSDILMASEALNETSYILICQLLRTSFDIKNWVVVHASMIAFKELLTLLSYKDVQNNEDIDIEYILGRLFSDERIQLLSNLPRTAFRHSLQYMKSCIDLTHSCLKILEKYSEDSLIIKGKNRSNKRTSQVSEEDIKNLMEEDNIDRDVAIDMLTPSFKQVEVNFNRVQNSYINDLTIDTYINFLQRFHELDHNTIKEVISFFNRVFTKAKEETYLYRLDLIILLRDMLSDNGLSKTSKTRKYVEEFSNYFLYRLKERLKISPAWFVGLLFPSLHDSQVGYFQRYGERKTTPNVVAFGLPPSRFKPIEDEDMLPPAVLRDIKIGILVSTLIDDGKAEILELLKTNIEINLSMYQSNLHRSETGEDGNQTVSNIPFSLPDEIKGNLLIDKDLRALLDFLGYIIPAAAEEKCILPESPDYSRLETDFNSFKNYLTTPFETPNGKASSTYLIRPLSANSMSYQEGDGWNGHEDYDYDDPGIIRDDEEYFKSLDNMDERLEGKTISKGLAKSKNKSQYPKKSKNRRMRSNLPTFDIDDDNPGRKNTKSQHVFASKEYISDSDDDDISNPIFYENEIYLRWLLDNNDGQLPPEKFTIYGKFRDERLLNGGEVNGDYTHLFDGPVPKLEDLKNSVIGTAVPNTILHDLSSKKMGDTFDPEELYEDEANDVLQYATEEVNTDVSATLKRKHDDLDISSEGATNNGELSENSSEHVSSQELSDNEFTDTETENVRASRKKSKIFVEEEEEEE